MSESPFEFYQFRDNEFDFWRCYKCKRIFTREEERAAIRTMQTDSEAGICVCGSLRYVPTRRPVGLEWLQPRVLRYIFKCIVARGIAPIVSNETVLSFLRRISAPI